MPVHVFRPAPRAGFTLIELLVVIAIIALLISILLPTLAGARRQGRIAATLSRLRDLGMNTSIYADAHKGAMPVLLDRDEKAFLGLSVLAREHQVPVQAFLNPNVRTDTPADQESTDERPILADLAGSEVNSASTIAPINLADLNWHCSFAYDNDAKRSDDGRNRVFLGTAPTTSTGRPTRETGATVASASSGPISTPRFSRPSLSAIRAIPTCTTTTSTWWRTGSKSWMGSA